MKTILICLICLIHTPLLTFAATDAENSAAVERFARHVDDQENGRSGYSAPSSGGGGMSLFVFIMLLVGGACMGASKK
jgi:hypothetical protein